jgi:hypothetical protein
MDGKGLTCTTRDWQTPNRIDSCRNQAITTHDSGLAGLGSGGVTGNSDITRLGKSCRRSTRNYFGFPQPRFLDNLRAADESSRIAESNANR